MGLGRKLSPKGKTNVEKENNQLNVKVLKDDTDTGSIDHPYVTVLNRKIRSLKKKQEKIKTLEQSVLDNGKTLNEQQLEVVQNKNCVDRLLVELEALRVQFIENFILHENKKEGSDVEIPTPEDEVKSVSTEDDTNKAQDTEIEDNQSGNDDNLNSNDSYLTEIALVESQATTVSDSLKSDKLHYVKDILKMLHVVNLYQAQGKEIPGALDFFAKVLMGTTRPPAEITFTENLDESLEEARKFLSKSDKIVAWNISYKHLQEIVDYLVNPVQVSSQVEVEVEDGKVDEPQDEDEVEKIPDTINFFAESQLDTCSNEISSEKVGEKVPEAAVVTDSTAVDLPTETTSQLENTESNEVAKKKYNSRKNKPFWNRKHSHQKGDLKNESGSNEGDEFPPHKTTSPKPNRRFYSKNNASYKEKNNSVEKNDNKIDVQSQPVKVKTVFVPKGTTTSSEINESKPTDKKPTKFVRNTNKSSNYYQKKKNSSPTHAEQKPTISI